MKLRIRGNTLRLRLSQGELGTLLERGFVEECVTFAAEARLRYRVERADIGAAQVEYRDNRITVRLPQQDVARWAEPQEVSIRAEQPAGDGKLELLVEKDFRCLSPREDEDDADSFPNPQGA
jgi:hypothetical protein